jgi:hypothetical protein
MSDTVKPSMRPCPICKNIIFVIGVNNKGKKIGSCGCTWKFKKTKSSKDLDRKYVRTADGGLELRK